MNPTMFEIIIAISMLAVIIALAVWIRRYMALASVTRMMAMMTRAGLDPAIAAQRRDPRAAAIIKQSWRRCRRCPGEDLCDRWLAGEAAGDNDFCSNARAFRKLAESKAHTS